MGETFTSTCKKTYCSESLLREWKGTLHLITSNLDDWPELLTLKWYACEDGILGYCKAKIWMGNPRLDSLLRDGRWMICFVLRLWEETLLLVVCRRRPSSLKINLVCWEGRLGLPLDRVVFVFMSWSRNGRLRRVFTESSHQEIPPLLIEKTWSYRLMWTRSCLTGLVIARILDLTLRLRGKKKHRDRS